ncbi:MAG TPA: hypothetical protein VGP25_17230, partial [Gemmatimonadaceae bacterium]|nr:hypothetical protein [Gemmatimonadaceae bacterium]
TVTAMAGCSSLDATSPNGSVAGTYSLVRLNGQLLPYTFSTGVTLVSDEVTLYRDGTYVDVSRYASGSTSTQEGFFTNTSGSIYFDSDASGIAPYQGSVSGDVLTEIVNGYTQTFERR